MTAFYMFRLYYKIFWWNNPDYGHHAPHEAPMTMTFPLIFLGLVSIVAGFIPFGSLVTLDRGNHPIEMDWTVAGTSVVIALVGIGLATVMYRKENDIPERLANQFRGLWTAAYHRFYMDELYQFITHKIIFARISKPIAWFDRRIIDGTMDLLANVTNSASFAVRRMQSGSVQTYVWFYLVGAVAVAVITIICLI